MRVLILSLLLAGCTSLSTTIGSTFAAIDTLATVAADECANPTPQDPCAATSAITTRQAVRIGQHLRTAREATSAANRAYQAGNKASASGHLASATAALGVVREILDGEGL